MPLVLETPHSLKDLVGRELTLTDWFPIYQERIEQFAEVTEDASGSTWTANVPSVSLPMGPQLLTGS